MPLPDKEDLKCYAFIIVVILFTVISFYIQQQGFGVKPIAGTECESDEECAFVIYSGGCTPLEKQCQSLALVDSRADKGGCNKSELKIDSTIKCECKEIAPKGVLHTGPEKVCTRVELPTR